METQPCDSLIAKQRHPQFLSLTTIELPLRPALFTSALLTNPDKSSLREEFYNIGAQLDFQLHVFSNFKMMLSVGYAVGFDDGDTRDEFMLSLKLM